MSEGDLNYLGQRYWRKRIYQIKQAFRSSTPEQSLNISEQTKAYGTELKPKRILHSAQPPRPKPEIASEPPRQSRSYYSG